jgi:gluconolactonase
MDRFECILDTFRWTDETIRWAVVCLGLITGLAAIGPAGAQQRPVPKGATVELVDDGFEFTEGPIWYRGTLLFSDIPANTVYQWTAENGSNVFMKPSGHANGLAIDTSGHLLLAQHDGQIGRRTEDGSVTVLAEAYGGKRLNSPNDLTVASDGTIYFTDPPYGVDEGDRELSFSGVYRLSPEGDLTLLTKTFARPNGVCLSPNDSTLYVNDSQETLVRAYDVTEDGDIANGRSFAAPTDEDAEGSTDGMKVDAEGNLYTTGPGGVWVYGPDGTQRARIAVPKAPTNLAFGGPDRKTLYITARPHVYRVSVNIPGAE